MFSFSIDIYFLFLLLFCFLLHKDNPEKSFVCLDEKLIHLKEKVYIFETQNS